METFFSFVVVLGYKLSNFVARKENTTTKNNTITLVLEGTLKIYGHNLHHNQATTIATCIDHRSDQALHLWTTTNVIPTQIIGWGWIVVLNYIVWESQLCVSEPQCWNPIYKTFLCPKLWLSIQIIDYMIVSCMCMVILNSKYKLPSLCVQNISN